MKKTLIYVDTSTIGGCCDPEFQEWSLGLLRDFQSLRVVFPAACGEFVIPAEAGIQKTGLDSASSAE